MAMLKGGQGLLGQTVYFPMLDGTVLDATVVNPIFYDPKEHGLMANSSKNKPVFSGADRTSKQIASKSPNPSGGSMGLAFHVMEHLGKLNIRGDNSLKAAVKAATGCHFPPLANHFETAGERHCLAWTR